GHDGLSAYGPAVRQGPVVEGQPWGGDVAVRGVQDRTVGGCEALAAGSAEVVLGDHKLSQSAAASTAQAGEDFQAGGPDGSENANSATGRWRTDGRRPSGRATSVSSPVGRCSAEVRAWNAISACLPAN